MRLLVLVIALGFTASAVLELRSRRLELLHAMAVLHLDMDRHRRAAWELQHLVSEATSPAALSRVVTEASNPDSGGVKSADRDAKPLETPTVRGFEAIPQTPEGPGP